MATIWNGNAVVEDPAHPNQPTLAWYDQLSQNMGGAANSALANIGTMSQNWYNQPLVAGLSQGQQNLINQGTQQAGSWKPQYAQGALAMMQAQGAIPRATNYSAGAMQQHLSPYLSGVMNNIATRGNRNLTENILPGVNSTFAGNGQFGSSRNADFTNRAIRDTAGEIANAQATAGNQAYQQAANDYSTWGGLGLQGANAMGNLGNQMGQYAQTGQNMGWTDIGKQYDLQSQQQQNYQQGLTANYNNWMAQQKTPLELMGSIASMMPNMTSLYNNMGSSSSGSSSSSVGASPLPNQNAYTVQPNNSMPSWLAALAGGVAGYNGGTGQQTSGNTTG